MANLNHNGVKIYSNEKGYFFELKNKENELVTFGPYKNIDGAKEMSLFYQGDEYGYVPTSE